MIVSIALNIFELHCYEPWIGRWQLKPSTLHRTTHASHALPILFAGYLHQLNPLYLLNILANHQSKLFIRGT